jgi:hypothetical protein
MVKLYFGFGVVDDDGFMEFQDNVVRTFCTVAEDETEAVAKIRIMFQHKFGVDPEQVYACEISKVEGYQIILRPVEKEG